MGSVRASLVAISFGNGYEILRFTARYQSWVGGGEQNGVHCRRVTYDEALYYMRCGHSVGLGAVVASVKTAVVSHC
jgi:hypothetical protein